MKKVNKYPLKWETKQTIELPIGAQIISCKSKDDETPAIYAVVDPTEDMIQPVVIVMLATYAEVDDHDLEHLKFLNTVKLKKKENGVLTTKYMVHVFVGVD